MKVYIDYYDSKLKALRVQEGKQVMNIRCCVMNWRNCDGSLSIKLSYECLQPNDIKKAPQLVLKY